MDQFKIAKQGQYRTPKLRLSLFARLFPSVQFYRDAFLIVLRGSRQAKHGRYGDADWCRNSMETLRALERAGVSLAIEGIDRFAELAGPCVFIGNHMSTLETFVLPALIEPYKNVTFVVKQSLVDYPIFRHIMRSRDPITVGRSNARDDLKAVLDGGAERLRSGTSIIIFPQTTRRDVFDPAQFNSIGIKLAKKAGVPVVPIALMTDAWGNGRILKDYGRVDPSKPVHIEFGAPLEIAGRGDEEHQQIIAFIEGKLLEWGGKVDEKR